jgi:TPR repeat protein
MLLSIATKCRVAAAAARQHHYTVRYYHRCAYAASPSLDVHRHNNIFLCRHFSQSVNQRSDTIHHNRRGDESYKLALEALQNAANAKQSCEEQLIREQYEAMERQRQKTSQRRNNNEQKEKDPRLQRLNAIDAVDEQTNVKDRAAGVAVVRTIVKQTRQSSQPNVKVEKWDSSKTAHDDDSPNTNNKQSVGVKLDEDYYQNEALQHLEEAALRYGHPLALVRLGNEALERAKKSSTSSDEPLINTDRCAEWIKESPVDLSQILAQSSNTIYNLEVDDDSSSPYISIAHVMYEEAGKAGSAEAWYNLGHLLWDRSEDNDTTKVKAMEAFNKAVDLGDSDAMYFVGAQYLSHQENEEAGYQLLRRAANDYNHGPALHHLALLSLQEGEIGEFRELLTKAAEAGNPDSLFLQGHCFYHGEDGYEVNVKAALNSFLEAAENFDHVDAMVSAGAILHQGVITPNGSYIIERDERRAFELYQQAGELGSMEGWRNVVACYATGEGVKKDIDMAKHIAKTMLKDDDR